MFTKLQLLTRGKVSATALRQHQERLDTLHATMLTEYFRSKMDGATAPEADAIALKAQDKPMDELKKRLQANVNAQVRHLVQSIQPLVDDDLGIHLTTQAAITSLTTATANTITTTTGLQERDPRLDLDEYQGPVMDPNMFPVTHGPSGRNRKRKQQNATTAPTTTTAHDMNAETEDDRVGAVETHRHRLLRSAIQRELGHALRVAPSSIAGAGEGVYVHGAITTGTVGVVGMSKCFFLLWNNNHAAIFVIYLSFLSFICHFCHFVCHS